MSNSRKRKKISDESKTQATPTWTGVMEQLQQLQQLQDIETKHVNAQLPTFPPVALPTTSGFLFPPPVPLQRTVYTPIETPGLLTQRKTYDPKDFEGMVYAGQTTTNLYEIPKDGSVIIVDGFGLFLKMAQEVTTTCVKVFLVLKDNEVYAEAIPEFSKINHRKYNNNVSLKKEIRLGNPAILKTIGAFYYHDDEEKIKSLQASIASNIKIFFSIKQDYPKTKVELDSFIFSLNLDVDSKLSRYEETSVKLDLDSKSSKLEEGIVFSGEETINPFPPPGTYQPIKHGFALIIKFDLKAHAYPKELILLNDGKLAEPLTTTFTRTTRVWSYALNSYERERHRAILNSVIDSYGGKPIDEKVYQLGRAISTSKKITRQDLDNPFALLLPKTLTIPSLPPVIPPAPQPKPSAVRSTLFAEKEKTKEFDLSLFGGEATEEECDEFDKLLFGNNTTQN